MIEEHGQMEAFGIGRLQCGIDHRVEADLCRTPTGMMSEHHMYPDVDYINPIKTSSLSPLHVHPTQMKLTTWYGLRSIRNSSDVNKDET
jgi:hypothetical protein